MKNVISKMLLMFAVVMTLSSCEKDEQSITVNDLPAVAQAFVKDYFGEGKILSTIKDKEGKNSFEFEVFMDNGVEIKFDQNGLWQEVDLRDDRQALPTVLFIHEAIRTYIETNYAGQGINGIERELYGFDVELTNDMDLVFDAQGKFIRIDK